MNGQSRKLPPESAVPLRPCDHPGCCEKGEYKAPKSRETLNDYYWFCLEHVRAYNESWDYYAGLGPDEIEQAVRRDVTWQRPTWPLGHIGSRRFRFDRDRVKDYFEVFEEDMWEREPQRYDPSSPEEQALRMMNLQLPLTIEALKARYKELCKLYHPDANGGDKNAEERFKLIGQAYRVLMNSLAPQT